MSNPQFDLVVVGGGMAGLVSACRATQLGLSVALVEQGDGESYPCNSRYSGGILHIAFQNIKDPPERLLDAVHDATYGYADPDLARALVHTSARAVDWLREEGAKFIRMPQSVWQQWVLAPPRPITPGLDWKGRGPDVTLRALMQNFRKRGGRAFMKASLSALIERGGACAGVQVSTDAGTLALDSKAVVIADGGFQANLELMRAHVSPDPSKLLQRGAANSRGKGLRSAQELGAAITDLSSFYGHLLSREALSNPQLWPYPQLDDLAITGVVVDAEAQRVADEGLGGVYLANMIARRRDPFDCFVLFDHHIWENAGRAARIPANPHLLRGGATMLQAESLESLARSMGVAPDRLTETVQRYNEALRSGELEQLHPVRSASKYTPMPIEQPPFHALPACVGVTYTTGGIAIDEEGRVRSKQGGIVEGLYAAGAATGGLEGGPKAGYVGGLMKALVFGLRAAEHLGSQRNS